MHMMRIRICRKFISGISLSVILAAGSSEILAETLSLSKAETIALNGDPSVRSVQSRQAALGEMEVAAGQLPDPLLKMGVLSLPVDSFELGQEPMTQLQLGIVQKFPRGDSRALRADQFRERAKGMGEHALDLELRIQLAVREEFFEVLKQQRLAEINREAEAAFSDLEEITQGYYATGRVQQQDVLSAAVEFAKVQERSSRIAEKEQRARARLGMWIQDAAWENLSLVWPTLTEPSSAQVIK
ncbi:MAG: outer membrane protein TolC, partial [Rhodothermales bacterium]